MRPAPAEQSPYRTSRRAVILGMVGGAVGALVAACGGSPTPTTAPVSSAAPSSSAPASAAASSAAPAASAPASASAAASASTGGAASAAPSSAAPASASAKPSASAAASAGPSAAAQPSVQPKRGGSFVISWYTGDPPDLDPYLNVTFRAQEFAGFFYSRLLKFNNGPGVSPNAFVPVPDLAESFQVSQDGLTYTFKLRANAKWHNKAPLNGRAVTADDVVYSFNRFRKDSPNKTQLDVVKECKADGANTVVFTLNQVFAPFETLMASPLFWIVPKEVVEADGDLRKKTIGSGPWLFDKYEKGVQIVAKKNPDYYFAGTPYVDEAVLLIIPDSATSVAALRAKQIDLVGVSQTDRKAVAASNPEIQFLDYPQNLLFFMYWRLDAPPFNDVRVRQAVSLALDRDELIAVLYEGTGYINNAIPAGLESYYLDPRSADMGPNAKYFKRDVAAAKKLLADAGQANLKVPLISPLNAYGNTFNQSIELVIKQLKEAGIDATLQAQDYAAYISSTFLGKFEAPTMVWGLQTPYQEPHDYLFNMYHPKGTRNHGGSTNDPTLTAMIEKQMTTLDKVERKKIIFDIQRYLGEKQYYVIGPVGNTTIATQPWVKNFNYQSDYGRGAEYVPTVWLDGKK